MIHFLLHTGAGLLVITLAASAVVGAAIWCAVTLAVALVAYAAWRVLGGYRPRGNPYRAGTRRGS